MKRILFCAWFIVVANVQAQRNLRDIPDASVAAELAKFEVADGFEISLFAADPLLAKPIQINFDPSGRLWVASSVTYPQIKPTGVPQDRIVVLEDRDGDGVADRSTVFADDLLIPNGVMPGDGGAYVAQASELLHLRDTDQDGRADERKVLLSGFGTQDTHHTLHGLTWGPGGGLYLLQGYYIATHVETLYGPRRLNGGGAWRYQPGTGRLEIYSRGLVNPWGIQFDRWGQTFQTDGAGGEGINYSFPGATFRASPGELQFLAGLNPGSPKLCGIEVLSGRHLPESMSGQLLANDFRANRMNRYSLSDDGSGFAATKLPDLLHSKHVSFRPIDIAMGPDGAIYLADWYSPIIQHGEVSFRDPRRDHVHGRIWRITAKDRELLERVDFTKLSDVALLDYLKVPEDYSRRQARRVLVERYGPLSDRGNRATLNVVLGEWQKSLDTADRDHAHHLLELLWLRQSLDWVDERLVRQLVANADHRVRAAAIRVLGEWQDRVAEAPTLLQRAAVDSHARVRLEAVRVLANSPTLQAVSALAGALDHDLDTSLEFALSRAFRDLQSVWLPPVEKGEFDFGGQTGQLLYALNAVNSDEAVASLLGLVSKGGEPNARDLKIWTIISQIGNAKQLQSVWDIVAAEGVRAADRAALVDGLIQSKNHRGIVASPSEDIVTELIESADATVKLAGVRAAGAFRVRGTDELLRGVAKKGGLTKDLEQAVFTALAGIGGWVNENLIGYRIAELDDTAEEAFLASLLVRRNPGFAAMHASRLITTAPTESSAWLPLVRTFISGRGTLPFLANALIQHPVPPAGAWAVLNEIGASGKELPELTEALTQAANINTSWSTLDENELKSLAQAALREGDAGRGAAYFRSNSLLCQSCHAIGGKGGKVGPDLSSIGASAPVDYLLESLVRPNAAIKEGYQTINVDTKLGDYFTGVRMQESSDTLILRGVHEDRIVIPKNQIDQRAKGRSLMPEGLVDPLSRQALMDLVRYLATLGKN